MAADVQSFELTSPGNDLDIRPMEPLFSMLAVCPVDSLMYLYNDLCNYKNESQLEDMFEEVGLNRREYIQQTQLAMKARHLI